jgi:hypothetical protein
VFCDGPFPPPNGPRRSISPFSARLLSDLYAENLPPRRPRQDPRAVKRKMSNYPLKPPRLTPSTTVKLPPPLPSIRVLWR